MIGLIGDKEADVHIQEELLSAGITLVRVPQNKAGVRYTFEGRLGNWTFNRAGAYWMADARDGLGLPLDVATLLHDRRYPIIGERQPETYGQVVRVEGDCGCPSPQQWAFPTREVLEAESVRIGRDLRKVNYGELARLFNEGTLQGQRFVNKYHVDTQEGLNEFARVLKSLHA